MKGLYCRDRRPARCESIVTPNDAAALASTGSSPLLEIVRRGEGDDVRLHADALEARAVRDEDVGVDDDHRYSTLMSPSPAACLSRPRLVTAPTVRSPMTRAPRSCRSRARISADDPERASTRTATVPAERLADIFVVTSVSRVPRDRRSAPRACPGGAKRPATRSSTPALPPGLSRRSRMTRLARLRSFSPTSSPSPRRRRSRSAASRGRRRPAIPASASAAPRGHRLLHLGGMAIELVVEIDAAPGASGSRRNRQAAAGAVALDGDDELRLRPQRGQEVADRRARSTASADTRRLDDRVADAEPCVRASPPSSTYRRARDRRRSATTSRSARPGRAAAAGRSCGNPSGRGRRRPAARRSRRATAPADPLAGAIDERLQVEAVEAGIVVVLDQVLPDLVQHLHAAAPVDGDRLRRRRAARPDLQAAGAKRAGEPR